MDGAGIDAVVAAFETAADRALAAGFRVIELHAAHGYLSTRSSRRLAASGRTSTVAGIRHEARYLDRRRRTITEVGHADGIVTSGDADLVRLARELSREPYWTLKAERELGAEPSWPTPCGYAVRRQAR